MEYASGVPEAQSAPLSFFQKFHIEKNRKSHQFFSQGLKGGANICLGCLVNGMLRIDSDFLEGRLSVYVRTHVGNGPRVSVRRMEHSIQEQKFS